RNNSSIIVRGIGRIIEAPPLSKHSAKFDVVPCKASTRVIDARFSETPFHLFSNHAVFQRDVLAPRDYPVSFRPSRNARRRFSVVPSDLRSGTPITGLLVAQPAPRAATPLHLREA